MAKNYQYDVRLISIEESKAHSCTGRIVSVIAATRNPTSSKWYLTVLVERSEDGLDKEN